VTYYSHILPIQGKKALNRSSATREMDGLSVIFPDYFHPLFTLQLHRGEAALRFLRAE
jgi:hypothetical protein